MNGLLVDASEKPFHDKLKDLQRQAIVIQRRNDRLESENDKLVKSNAELKGHVETLLQQNDELKKIKALIKQNLPVGDENRGINRRLYK
jgi:hypothetical protein